MSHLSRDCYVAMIRQLSSLLIHLLDTCTINSDDVGEGRIATISKNSNDVGGFVLVTNSMTYRGRGLP